MILPPKTLAEIGKELNVTKERIRQIEKKALIALKKEMQMFNMISYLA